MIHTIIMFRPPPSPREPRAYIHMCARVCVFLCLCVLTHIILGIRVARFGP